MALKPVDHLLKKVSLSNALLACTITFLLACMALPSVASLAHAIYQHQERDCSDDARLHFHSAEFDCEFQKFKNTTPFYTQPVFVKLKVQQHYRELVIHEYDLIDRFTQHSLLLRGPPAFS